jgi:hypothetical protein
LDLYRKWIEKRVSNEKNINMINASHGARINGMEEKSIKDIFRKKYEVLAVIPARSGSKSVKDKNIRLIAGKPMIAYSIEHACLNTSISSAVSVAYSSGRKNGTSAPYSFDIFGFHSWGQIPIRFLF